MGWKLPKYIKTELSKTDLPHELEKRKRHYLLRIAGEAVTIIPYADVKGGRHQKNNIAEIRRAIRRLET